MIWAGMQPKMMMGLIEGLCTGVQGIITYPMVLSLQIEYLAHLALEGLTIPIIVSKQKRRLTPTPGAALVSPIAGDRFSFDLHFCFILVFVIRVMLFGLQLECLFVGLWLQMSRILMNLCLFENEVDCSTLARAFVCMLRN